MTYKTLTTTNAGTTGSARIRIRTDLGCTIHFVLSDKKSTGEEKRVCDFTCYDEYMSNKYGIQYKIVISKFQIQQESEDSWGVEHIEIEDVKKGETMETWVDDRRRWRYRSYYSLDGKNKSFWMDGRDTGNYDDLLKCTNGKWCDLHKIGKDKCQSCNHFNLLVLTVKFARIVFL